MLTTSDLNQIKGLCDYLNRSFSPPNHDIAADVTLSDSNGDMVGKVYYSSDVAEHVFEML